MFYEIVSGQRPFAGETVSGVIGKHLRQLRRPCRQRWVCRGEYQPRSWRSRRILTTVRRLQRISRVCCSTPEAAPLDERDFHLVHSTCPNRVACIAFAARG